ncbi:MAG: DAPG hydrolase family protein [Vibrio sp.]
MPGVTGEMWDWWFGWHGTETARYKLWHPDAHLYSAMGENRSNIPGLTDRQKYINNVSYVDEYLGSERSPLSVRFIDPEKFGFSPSKKGETVIVARGGLSTMPISFAWLIHQVRATPDGAEMRSRFFVNDIKLLELPSQSVASKEGKILTNSIVKHIATPTVRYRAKRKLREFGPDMLFHCASEMNHLASFLPELYKEFSGQ